MERRKNAFTLIELLVVISIIALLIGILLPALGQAQRSAKNVISQANQRSLNTGAANYAADNRDRIFSYTWRAGETYNIPGQTPKTMGDDTDAASWQNTEILRRVTGRSTGTGKILNYVGRLPHRRYSHLVLLDFLTDKQPEPTAASPFDRNLINWQENPLEYLEDANSLPYGTDDGNDFDGYDQDGNWRLRQFQMRWPFAMTYQMIPAAWCDDGIGGAATYAPVEDTPHLFRAVNNEEGNPQLGRRKFTQVAHASSKVMMFEEFDRFTDKDGLYFAYPDAKPNLAFFDGSVRQENTSDANPGWSPEFPEQEWRQTYVPLHTYPEPRNGLNDPTLLCQRFRWTRYGLQGVDFGGGDVGRRTNGLDPASEVQCVEEN